MEITIDKIRINEVVSSLLSEHPILFTKLKKLPIDPAISPQELLEEIIKFLYLVAKFEEKLSPSLIVDYGWHEFILFTKLYHKFCNEQLGRFIHHTPDDNKMSNANNYLRTIKYYINQFGEPPVMIWGELAQEEWQDAQCGSCQAK